MTGVFVVSSDNHARLRLVQTGIDYGSQVEIVAGVDAGEPVVVQPPVSLVDGAPVRTAKTSARANEGGLR